MLGSRIAPGSSEGSFGSERIYTCPVAAAQDPAIAEAVSLFRRVRLEGVSLRDIYPHPSNAAFVALEVLEPEVSALFAVERKERD